MKISCRQQDLLSSINIALKAVSTKSTMPVLECLFIETIDGKIKISSSNMELNIDTILNGRVEEEGQVALNSKIFSDMVRKLPDDMVNISVDENYLTTLKCGKSKFTISGLSGYDFPKIPEFSRDDSVEISHFTLREIIRQTIFSVSDNENNKVMTGEHFEINDNILTVTSLDGHRISMRNVELKQSYDSKDVIIPGKSLNEIIKLLDTDIEKYVTIYFSDKNIIFEFDDTIVLSRLIEGRYLNVRQMINDDFDTKFTVNKKEFYDCFDRSMLLVKESEKRPLIIGIYDGRITLNMKTSIGTLDEEIEVEKEGKDMMIGFNPKFIMDVLRVIDDDEITIYMTNAKAPCFIRNESSSYNYLVLPVNFNI
jgi:DNA polymerase-3 subunit beta